MRKRNKKPKTEKIYHFRLHENESCNITFFGPYILGGIPDDCCPGDMDMRRAMSPNNRENMIATNSIDDILTDNYFSLWGNTFEFGD